MAFMEFLKFPARNAFPATGDNNRLYIDLRSKRIYYWEHGAYQIASPDIVEQGSNPISEAFSYAGIVETVEELPTEGIRIGDVYIVEQDEGHEQNSAYVWSGSQWIEIGGDMEHLVAISWADLKALRDAGELKAGQQYRITDYTCTTIQTDTQSAGHQFDIIVTADSVSELNEQARAIQHAGDTYFANSQLEAWQVWYSLDNDTSRFEWADNSVNGKGVIYRMIDEFNNDVPYDFKNILFVKNEIEVFTFGTMPGVIYNQWGSNYRVTRNETLDIIVSEVQYYGYTCSNTPGAWSTPNFWVMDDVLSTTSILYQISDETVTQISITGTFIFTALSDDSLTYTTRGNVMQPVFSNGPNYYTLNFNTFGIGCKSNTFGTICYSNTFGNLCSNNTFGNNCHSNTFENYCDYNTFGQSCYSNTFGDHCSSNTFVNKCSTNTFGAYCKSNTFGTICYSNTFGNLCSNNTFGNNCHSNTFGGNSSYNTFGNGCHNNTFGDYCSSNIFGNNCYYNKITSNNVKYISVDNGLHGASTVNKLELYDLAIFNKEYQINYKKDISGRYLMLWATDTGAMTGKYKALNTDLTWTDIEESDYIEVDITDLLVSTEDYTMTSNNLKAWKQGRVYGVCGIISLSLAGGNSLANGTALITAIPEAYRPNQSIMEHTDVIYNGLRSFQLKNDGVITVYPTAIAGGAGTILIHIDFVYNK